MAPIGIITEAERDEIIQGLQMVKVRRSIIKITPNGFVPTA